MPNIQVFQSVKKVTDTPKLICANCFPGKILSAKKRSLLQAACCGHGNPLAVDMAIALIFSSTNVSYTSWGTTIFQDDGTTIQFLVVSRTTTRSVMYKQYLEVKEIPAADKLQRASF